MTVIHVTDADFSQKVLQSEKPVLLDFWAPWCGPCKAIGPILDKLSLEFANDLVIAKMNVDENQSTPTQYGVRGIPFLCLFKNGELSATKVGASPEAELRTWIGNHLD